MAPVLVGPQVAVTMHGRAGDVAATVDDLALRIGAFERVDPAEANRYINLIDAAFGTVIPMVDRARLHARSDIDRLWAVADDDIDDLDEHLQLWPLGWCLATRWRRTTVLAVPGGELTARTWAPMGTMTVVLSDAAAAICDLGRWDRVTAALVEAAAAGADPAAAAIEAGG